MSADEMDKFEKKEMKKIRAVENTWYDSPIQTVYGRGKKLGKPKIQNIRNSFILKKKEKKKKIKIRDIGTLFETE